MIDIMTKCIKMYIIQWHACIIDMGMCWYETCPQYECYSSQHMGRLVCQRHVSRAGTSNCVPPLMSYLWYVCHNMIYILIQIPWQDSSQHIPGLASQRHVSRTGTNNYIFTSSVYDFVNVWDCGDVFSEDLDHDLITGLYINGLDHDIIMGAIASQITSLVRVYSAV